MHGPSFTGASPRHAHAGGAGPVREGGSASRRHAGADAASLVPAFPSAKPGALPWTSSLPSTCASALRVAWVLAEPKDTRSLGVIPPANSPRVKFVPSAACVYSRAMHEGRGGEGLLEVAGRAVVPPLGPQAARAAARDARRCSGTCRWRTRASRCASGPRRARGSWKSGWTVSGGWCWGRRTRAVRGGLHRLPRRQRGHEAAGAQ